MYTGTVGVFIETVGVWTVGVQGTVDVRMVGVVGSDNGLLAGL